MNWPVFIIFLMLAVAHLAIGWMCGSRRETVRWHLLAIGLCIVQIFLTAFGLHSLLSAGIWAVVGVVWAVLALRRHSNLRSGDTDG